MKNLLGLLLALTVGFAPAAGIATEAQTKGVGMVTVKMETSMGDITLELDGDKAPDTVANFVEYANAGFYDGTIFHLREGEYRLCSQERHFAWLQAAAIGFDVTITHETEDVAALAVQGPTSYSVLSKMNLEGLAELKPFGLMHVDFQGTELMVSRTGFTGDLGYELPE